MPHNRILLINPWIYDFAAYDLWIKPLGLMYIQGLLERNGYQTRFIDCLDRAHPELLRLQGKRSAKNRHYGSGPYYKERVEKPEVYRNVKRHYGRYGITEQIFRNDLANTEKPDVVLVTSGMTYWYPGPFRVIEMVRECFPGMPILLGGIYATLCPEHARQFSGADVVVQGEGELETLCLVDELTGHRSSYWPDPQDLDSFPWPVHADHWRAPWMPLLTSRGCPLRCSYCASKLLNLGFRQRDPGQVLEELEHTCRKLGIRTFVFYDDALLHRASEHIGPLLDGVIEKGLSCTFHTPNGLSPKEIDRGLASQMYVSGFKTVCLSLETSDPVRQQELGCKVSNDDLAVAVENLRAAGYQPKDLNAYVLVGLPGQALEEVVASILFVARLGAKTRLAFYSPIPGTGEWEKAVQSFGFDPHADPLLHNCSIHPFALQRIEGDDWQQVQSLANLVNASLDSHVNLLDDSTLARTFRQVRARIG